MANLSYNDIARAINLSLKEGGSAKSVVEFLSRKKLLSKSEDILAKLEAIVDTEKGILKGKLWSATALSNKEKTELISHLEKHHKDKKIQLEEIIDEKLKGGWKVEIAGEMIDQSIQTKLKKLQAHLNKNHV